MGFGLFLARCAKIPTFGMVAKFSWSALKMFVMFIMRLMQIGHDDRMRKFLTLVRLPANSGVREFFE